MHYVSLTVVDLEGHFLSREPRSVLWWNLPTGGVWMLLYEGEIRSVEGPGAGRGGPEGTAPCCCEETARPEPATYAYE